MTRPHHGGLIENWRSTDAPFADKFRMAVSNTWTKVRKRSRCCGNHGQPGC